MKKEESRGRGVVFQGEVGGESRGRPEAGAGKEGRSQLRAAVQPAPAGLQRQAQSERDPSPEGSRRVCDAASGPGTLLTQGQRT